MKRFIVEYWSEEDNTFCVVDTQDMHTVVLLPGGKMAVTETTAKNWAAYYESNPTEAETI